jgi:putative signal transducing protein
VITVKTFATRPEAEIAKIALDAAEVPSVIVGVDVGMEGGIAGIKLQVPEDFVASAREILEHA